MPLTNRLGRISALALALALPGAALAQAPATPPPAPPAAAPGAVTPAAPAPRPDAVLARVDGRPITEADLATAADDPSLSIPGVTDAQKRDLLLGYVIDLRVGARAAEAAKVQDNPDFARKLAYFRDKLLLDEYLEGEVKKAVTPDASRKLYDDTVKALKPEEEVHARHILVDDEAEAKRIAARVKGGEDFAKVAAEVSKDPGSKAEGGDLGFFTKERMVPAFADAAFAMKPGEVSDPVKSQFGWHVIKLEERRTKPVPGYDEMKEQVDAYLTRKAQQDLVLKLREGAKVERLDAPAATSASPGAAQAAPAPAAPAPAAKP